MIEANIWHNFQPELVTDPQQPNEHFEGDSVIDLREEYYRRLGWITNLETREQLEFVFACYKNKTPLNTFAINEYNEFLDGSIEKTSARTYAFDFGTGRFAFGKNTLLHPGGNFATVISDKETGEEKQLEFFDKTELGAAILEEMEDFMDFERLVPSIPKYLRSPKNEEDREEFERLSYVVTKYVLGASLNELKGMKQPLPQWYYEMVWVPDPPRIPVKYWDIYGEDLKIHGLFKVLGLDPKTKLVEPSTVAVISSPTQKYIEKCQSFLEYSEEYLSNPDFFKNNNKFTFDQSQIIIDLANAIKTYRLDYIIPQAKAS